MQATIDACKLELVTGDITRQATDAIVNAANSRLAGGGGVDGAIHRGGGPDIMEETQRHYPHGCPTGDAVVTGAGELPAQCVIHAVGPIWQGGQNQEESVAGKRVLGAASKSLAPSNAPASPSLRFQPAPMPTHCSKPLTSRYTPWQPICGCMASRNWCDSSFLTTGHTRRMRTRSPPS